MEPTSADSDSQLLVGSAKPSDSKCFTGWEWVTPEVVTKFSCATEDFLCPASANTYGIDFIGFIVRDADTGRKLLEITKEPRVYRMDELRSSVPRLSFQEPPHKGATSRSAQMEEAAQRNIRYQFGPRFLELEHVGTKLEFTVGDKPVHNFRMIERHYFKDKILKSYDFTMPYCMPNTVNTWEVIYELPELTAEEKKAMIEAPWETKSDSFYFIDDILVMHHKADYSYAEDVE